MSLAVAQLWAECGHDRLPLGMSSLGPCVLNVLGNSEAISKAVEPTVI